METNQFFAKLGPFSLKEIIETINCTSDVSLKNDLKIYTDTKNTKIGNTNGDLKIKWKDVESNIKIFKSFDTCYQREALNYF